MNSPPPIGAPIPISAYTMTSALGAGIAAHDAAIRERRGALARPDVEGYDVPGWVGRVTGLAEVELPPELQRYDCRNNRLAWLALQQDQLLDHARALVRRYGPDRVAVYLGTSTSGIAATEAAYRTAAATDFDSLPAEYDYTHTHNVHSVSAFVREAIGSTGAALTISTACSSSAKVFASAARALAAGVCDAAVVGGVDSLCLTTLFGFHALQLVSEQPCRPADARRDGISIGEAGGFAILDPGAAAAPFALLGYGESSDAYHMSSPDPDGHGAADAMRMALARAGLEPETIGYINLHGTGTPANDAAEDRAVSRLFGNRVPGSSTKGFTGHTLGAAGILEAGLCLNALAAGLLPGSLNTTTVDPAFGGRILTDNCERQTAAALSNSFGFGGTNCSLVLGRSR